MFQFEIEFVKMSLKGVKVSFKTYLLVFAALKDYEYVSLKYFIYRAKYEIREPSPLDVATYPANIPYRADILISGIQRPDVSPMSVRYGMSKYRPDVGQMSVRYGMFAGYEARKF